jgi:hypothetical protein
MVPSLTLHQAQVLHVRLTASLIKFAFNSGYELTWGETYRTREQAALDAAKGSGIAHSLHCDRLAVDFQLFKDGAYLTDPVAYKFLGDFWKSLHPLCAYGGDFHTVDGDHFSIAFGGRK